LGADSLFQRAIAGVGAAGVFSGSLIIIAYSSPMEKRPVYQSMLGGMFGIASIVGPLVNSTGFSFECS